MNSRREEAPLAKATESSRRSAMARGQRAWRAHFAIEMTAAALSSSLQQRHTAYEITAYTAKNAGFHPRTHTPQVLPASAT